MTERVDVEELLRDIDAHSIALRVADLARERDEAEKLLLDIHLLMIDPTKRDADANGVALRTMGLLARAGLLPEEPAS